MPKKGRSPNYPAIGLRTAIERAQSFYQKERLSAVPPNAAIESWGHKPKSSSGLQTISALLKFGIIEEQGRGTAKRVRLSELGKRIVLNDNVDSPDRIEAIQTAALNPAIHKRLWEQYAGQLPSDTSLRYELRKEGFIDVGLDSFLKELRETVDFAKLVYGQADTPAEQPPSHIEQPAPAAPQAISRQNTTRLLLPVTHSKTITLEGPFPLDEAEWTQFTRVLEAMKPALVTVPSSQDRKSQPDK